VKPTWRWFGPKDVISIDQIRQTSATGIVTALHHIPPGEVWTTLEIEARRALIEQGGASGLTWDVIESLPVSEAIKKQSGPWREHIAAYKTSLENLAKSGLEVICYNFMPVLDWTRTDLAYALPSGATCMRFDLVDFAAFDLFILERDGAGNAFDQALIEEARARFETMSETRKTQLADNVVCGLPGAADSLTMDGVKELLGEYGAISVDQLRANMIAFLEEVAPVAERLGLRLCCHPDDPPVPLLGLPRIMSTEADYRAILDAVDVNANGVTLCSGSLGARPDNDLPAMMESLGERVHFIHLRNVWRESRDVMGSFYEAEHLGGHTDMVALIRAILNEEERRRASGRKDISIPFRPDHGQDMLDDLKREAQPGYPLIGRMKGLAELAIPKFVLHFHLQLGAGRGKVGGHVAHSYRFTECDRVAA